jgi:hypothetical protein
MLKLAFTQLALRAVGTYLSILVAPQMSAP